MAFISILCLMLVGITGTVAYAGDLDWKTTSVTADSNNILCIRGYFTNNRADRVITQINWFNPMLTLTFANGYKDTINTQCDAQECYIEPGCTYDMTFYVENTAGRGWTHWTTRSKFNYHYETIKG